jgi:hypothetical protein
MFFSIIILFTIIFIQEYILIKQLTNKQKPRKNKYNNEFENAKNNANPELINNINEQTMDPIKIYDYKKIYDPLENPTKRPEKYIIGDIGIRKYLNIATQGYPDNFHLIGTITNDDTSDNFNRVLKLFGRQKYPKSNEYEYYVMINMGNDNIKVNLSNKKELYDDDVVKIDELNKEYTVKLYKQDELIYNPFV